MVNKLKNSAVQTVHVTSCYLHWKQTLLQKFISVCKDMYVSVQYLLCLFVTMDECTPFCYLHFTLPTAHYDITIH